MSLMATNGRRGLLSLKHLQFPYQPDKAHKTKERKMNRLWVLPALLVVAAAWNATAEPPPQAADAKILNKWLGPEEYEKAKKEQ